MVYNKNGLPKQTLLRISFVIFMTHCVEQSYSLVTCPRRVSGFSPTKSARKHNIDLVRHDLKGGNRLQNRIVMNLSKGVDNDNDNNDENNQKITKKFLERNKNWIILVDDEEAIRSAVGDFLYDSGYQVTACADAEALLELVATGGKKTAAPAMTSMPSAIVSDIRMPAGEGDNNDDDTAEKKLDGLELVRVLRSDPRLLRVPIILLTAKALTQDRIAGYKAGADVYLPKPFAPEELLAILDNAIVRRQQMTVRDQAQLADLQEDMATIKEVMKQNAGKNLVKKTEVYLTPVEREVLELLSRGYTNAEIANARSVNIKGVIQMLQKLYVRTNTSTRTELVRWGLETGYLSPSNRPSASPSKYQQE